MLHIPRPVESDPLAIIDASVMPLKAHDSALVELVNELVELNDVAAMAALYDGFIAAHDGFQLIRNMPRSGRLVPEYFGEAQDELYSKAYYVAERLKEVTPDSLRDAEYCRVLTSCARAMGSSEAEILAVHVAALARVEASAS